MNKFIPFSLACVALMAAAQGAAVGQIEDVAFELDGQEFHLRPIEKRQVNPDPSGSKSGGGNNNQGQCQTIDLPATLSLKVCGCNNPGCPKCPCGGGGNNNEDIRDQVKNNSNNIKAKTRAHYAPKWNTRRQ